MDTEHSLAIEQIANFIDEKSKPSISYEAEPGTEVLAPVVIDHSGVKPLPASTFDDYRTAPVRRKGTATLNSLDSFIAHAIRFKDADSLIFADDRREAPSLTSVLDYHRAGSDASPRFGQHRGHFAFPLSDEWKAWSKMDAKPMPMREFAAFIEDRVIDVLHLIPEEDELPEDLQKFVSACGGTEGIATPQRLVELSRGLQVNEDSVVKEAIRLTSGEGQVLFQSEHRDATGAPLRIPSLFLLALPVFRNDGLYRLAARLRYRKTAEGIVFWYDLWRADRVFDHAFTLACERARIETGLPLLLGKPE
jgi:hypothetical protein